MTTVMLNPSQMMFWKWRSPWMSVEVENGSSAGVLASTRWRASAMSPASTPGRSCTRSSACNSGATTGSWWMSSNWGESSTPSRPSGTWTRWMVRMMSASCLVALRRSKSDIVGHAADSISPLTRWTINQSAPSSPP